MLLPFTTASGGAGTSTQENGNGWQLWNRAKHSNATGKTHLQKSGSGRNPAVIIGGVFLCLALYLWHSLSSPYYGDDDISSLDERTKLLYYPQHISSQAKRTAESVKEISLRLNLHSSILHSSQREKLPVYLTALYHSVSIVELPLSPILHKALKDCDADGKTAVVDGLHGLEIAFPSMLRAMDTSADILASNNSSLFHQHRDLLQLLHPRSMSITLEEDRHYHTHIIKDTKASPFPPVERPHAFDEPLFFLVNSFPYTVAYCTHHPQSQSEGWRSGARYLQEIASMIVHTQEWREHEGLNFFSLASHSKTGPISAEDSRSFAAFIRQSYLRANIDGLGSLPKDILVPNALPSHIHSSIANLEPLPNDITRKLLVFIDEDSSAKSPWQRYLHRLEHVNDVEFVPAEKFPLVQDRIAIWQSSSFCLWVRGKSSAPLASFYEMIATGCVPVIVGDWVHLPFDSIVDYHQFSLRFFDSIVHDLPKMLSALRSVDSSRLQQLREGVREAQRVLLYAPGDHHRPLLNPVSLAMIEMLQRREQVCQQQHMTDVNLPSLCLQILNRIHAAEELLRSKKSSIPV